MSKAVLVGWFLKKVEWDKKFEICYVWNPRVCFFKSGKSFGKSLPRLSLSHLP